jgi:hypothetical protein
MFCEQKGVRAMFKGLGVSIVIIASAMLGLPVLLASVM